MKECVTPAVSHLSVFIQSTSPCNFPMDTPVPQNTQNDKKPQKFAYFDKKGEKFDEKTTNLTKNAPLAFPSHAGIQAEIFVVFCPPKKRSLQSSASLKKQSGKPSIKKTVKVGILSQPVRPPSLPSLLGNS